MNVVFKGKAERAKQDTRCQSLVSTPVPPHAHTHTLINMHIQKGKKKSSKDAIRLTCRYSLSAFSLLSSFSSLFACSGTSSFIFIMHFVSRTTSKILGSKLTSNFPVSGCRTNSVACKAAREPILALISLHPLCFTTERQSDSPGSYSAKAEALTQSQPTRLRKMKTRYIQSHGSDPERESQMGE